MDTETTETQIGDAGGSLCKHGSADRTADRIADHSSVSIAAIHTPFDTKAELQPPLFDDLIDQLGRIPGAIA